MTEKEKLEAAMRGELHLAQASAAPTAPEPKEPGVIERFQANMEDSWKTGTIAGQAYLHGKSAIVGKNQVLKDEKQREAEFKAMKGWNDGAKQTKEIKYTDEMGNETSAVVQSDPNFLNTMVHGAAALGGQLVGNLATPEALLIPAPARLAIPAVNATTQTGRALSKAALGAGMQGGINAATDPLIQGSQVLLGTKDSFDPTQTALNTGMGILTGGAFPNLPKVARELEERNRMLRAATGNPHASLTDFHGEFKMPDDLKGDKYIGSFNTEKTKMSESAYDEVGRVVKDNDQYAEARRLHLGGDIEQVKRLADDLGRDEEYFLRRWEPGTTFAPEDIWQIRKLHANAAENVVNLSRLARDGDEFAMQEAAIAYQRFQQFEAILQGSATEWGRTGAIFNEVISTEARNAAIQSIERKFGGILQPKEFFAMMAALDDPRMVRKFAREAEKVKTGKMLVEAWQSALLTSPDTHVANIVGGLINTLMSTPESIGASLVGKARQAVFGGEDPVATRAAAARIGGMLQGAVDGFRLAAQAYKTESAPGIQTRDVHQHIPDAWGGKVIRTALRALLAEDTFFKNTNKHMALTEMAIDEAIKRKLSGAEYSTFIRNYINNPPAHVASKANAVGSYYTFNSDLGKMGNAILQFKESHPLAAVIMPFVRTPINIIKQGFERSPLGLIYAANGARTGALKGKELDMAISRATIGSGVMAYATWLAYEGRISGQGPMDGGLRAAITDTGDQPVSVRIGDQYHSFSRIQPIGMILGLAADQAQLVREWEDSVRSGRRDEADNPYPEALWRSAQYATWAMTKNMLQGSFVTQLNNLFDAMTAPDRNLQRFVNTTAGSVIPTVVARIAQGTDPIVRDPGTMAEAVAARIPGETDKAQPMLNRFGEARRREGGLLETLFSPSRRTKAKDDPVYNEIAKLGISFEALPRYWAGKRLTPDQYTDLVQFTGRLAREQIQAFVTSPGYDGISDEIKIEKIREFMEGATETGKSLFIAKYKDFATEPTNEYIRKLQLEPRKQYPTIQKANEAKRARERQDTK
jgi:hypothetical protein